MIIYIASSWKNQHAVELLTEKLRKNGHEVLSFVENARSHGWITIPFEEWIKTDKAKEAFAFDTTSSMP